MAPFARAESERDQCVFGIDERMRAFGDERIRAARRRVAPRSGHREHSPAVLQRVPRGDHRPTRGGGFHDDAAVAESGDDPIPHGEVLRSRLDAEGMFGHEQPRPSNALVEQLVAPGIHHVEAGRDDADHRAARVERAVVDRGVDPDRESAHDDHTGSGEHTPELVRVGQPVWCRGPGPDHRDSRTLERVGSVTFDEEHRRTIVDALLDRVPGVACGEHSRVASGESLGGELRR